MLLARWIWGMEDVVIMLVGSDEVRLLRGEEQRRSLLGEAEPADGDQTQRTSLLMTQMCFRCMHCQSSIPAN